MWRVLLVSAGLHVLLIASLRRPKPEYPVVWPSFAPPTPHRDEVIEVTWIDVPHEPVTDQRVAPSVTDQRVARSRGQTSSSQASEQSGASRPGEVADSNNANKRGPDLMSMRGPELRPGDAALEHIADAPGHEPQQGAHSGRIDDAAGGRGRIDDAVTTVEVDRDGTAHFRDKGDAEAHANLDKATLQRAAHEEANYIAAWAEATDPDTANNHEHDVEASCDDHSLFMCNYKYPKQNANGVSLLGGKLDVTSYLMRKAGIDPNASKKLRLLDDTRAERVERGAQYRSQQLAKSGEIMQANLQRLWASTRDTDERRAVLFTLWDECDEGEGESGESGERARAMVIGWIRSHIAYTAAQVKALNARRTSKQTFAP